MVYGILDGVQLGIGRESIRQTYSAHIKAKIKSQAEEFPINLVLYGTANVRTDLREDQFPLLKFGDRMSYASTITRFQEDLLISFSFLIAPTLHKAKPSKLRIVTGGTIITINSQWD